MSPYTSAGSKCLNVMSVLKILFALTFGIWLINGYINDANNSRDGINPDGEPREHSNETTLVSHKHITNGPNPIMHRITPTGLCCLHFFTALTQFQNSYSTMTMTQWKQRSVLQFLIATISSIPFLILFLVQLPSMSELYASCVFFAIDIARIVIFALVEWFGVLEENLLGIELSEIPIRSTAGHPVRH